MGILSENNNQKDYESNEEDYPDTFLQDEFLMINNDLKDNIRDLLEDKETKLEPKDLQTLLEVLKESYDFDYRLKHRKYEKEWDYEKRKLFKHFDITSTYDLKDSWDYDLRDKKDY